MLRFLALCALLLGAGCTLVASRSVGRFLDAHYVLTRGDAWRLEGPYETSTLASPTTVALTGRKHAVTFILRGIASTGVPEMDRECIVTLSLTRSGGGAYIRTDSIHRTPDGEECGVLYTPANRVFTGKDENGVFQYENLTYVMPQLLMITEGYCLVDHSDTGYPLYEVFKQGEQLARKAHRGYWAVPAHRKGADSGTAYGCRVHGRP